MVVLVRLFSKLVVKAKLCPDDWAILATVIACTAGTVVTLYGIIPNGFGKDIWTIPFDKITVFARFFYIGEIMYVTSISLLKLSLLLFYLGIFQTRGVRRLLWSSVVFNMVSGVIFALFTIFLCSPIDFEWDRWGGEHQGTCMNLNTLAWIHAAVSIVLDVWILAIPLSQLRTLNLHWKRKVGVALMFCVGTL